MKLPKPDSSFTRARDLVCVVGFDGYFKQLNALWESSLGWTLEELKAKPVFDWIDPGDRERVIAALRRIAEQGEPGRFEMRVPCKNGGERWLEWTTRPFQDDQVFYAVARDVTPQKATEQALHESEELFRSVAGLATEGFVVHEEGRILEVNQSLAELFGYAPADLVGRPVADLAGPGALDIFGRGEDGRPYVGLGRRKDGTTFEGEIVGRACRFRGRSARVTRIRPLRPPEA